MSEIPKEQIKEQIEEVDFINKIKGILEDYHNYATKRDRLNYQKQYYQLNKEKLNNIQKEKYKKKKSVS